MFDHWRQNLQNANKRFETKFLDILFWVFKKKKHAEIYF